MDLRTESRNVAMTPRWQSQIEKDLEKLEKKTSILHARVTLTKNKHHKKKSDVAEVVVVLSIPGTTITARKTAKTFEEAIDAAFAAVGREIGSFLRGKRSTEIRNNAPPLIGTVDRILDGFGFILLEDGEQVYFHRNAVHDLPFESLSLGTRVALNVETGEKGLQATTVNPLPPTDRRAGSIEEYAAENRRR